MRLRTKLFAGLMLLFVVISLLAAVGSYAVYKLDKSSEEILSNNFASVEYSVAMLNSLDKIRNAQQIMLSDPNYSIKVANDYKRAKQQFRATFDAQADNITEKNETNLVAQLNNAYTDYISSFESAQSKKGLTLPFYTSKIEPLYSTTKDNILVIYELNRNALLARNVYANELATNNSLFIITLGLLSVGLTFAFILYFPIYITKPLVHLKEKLQAVSNYDYSQQLQIKSTDELRFACLYLQYNGIAFERI